MRMWTYLYHIILQKCYIGRVYYCARVPIYRMIGLVIKNINFLCYNCYNCKIQKLLVYRAFTLFLPLQRELETQNKKYMEIKRTQTVN